VVTRNKAVWSYGETRVPILRPKLVLLGTVRGELFYHE